MLRTWLASLPDALQFPALRYVEATGERLYAQDLIRLSRRLEGDWRIGHIYASAEAGAIAAQVFTASRLPDAGIVAAGQPVDGVEVFIKDEVDALVPPGEIGEIVVRSRFLAQGYWNNPELTATVFQTDPLDSAVRIYRTGDLGRWRSDGALEHMGRKGRRIRLRGYTSSLSKWKASSCVSRALRTRLCCCMTVSRTKSHVWWATLSRLIPSPSALRKGLAEQLPSYMVPAHIVVLDSFPIASSGKIDHKALPPPFREEARVWYSARRPTTASMSFVQFGKRF